MEKNTRYKKYLEIIEQNKKKHEKQKKIKEKSVFLCKHCNSSDTVYYDQQIRGSDESTSLVIICNACGYKNVL